MATSDREARLAYNRNYYKANRARLLQQQKQRDQQRDIAEPGARAAYQRQYQDANKAALLEKQRTRNRANYQAKKKDYAERQRRASLKRYGLTPELKAAILERQEHQCPICERFLSEATVPSIDHCHVTGSVRGILCRRCNSALGLFEESPEILERAVEYLSMPRLPAFVSWLSGATSTQNKTP